MSKLGLGWVALLVIILTSATANAVNLMAAGISLTNITKKIKPIPALWILIGLRYVKHRATTALRWQIAHSIGNG